VRYWDTSAVLPLLIDESETARAKRLVDEDPAIAAWWADTHGVPAWRVGKRGTATGYDFILDLKARLRGHIQLSTDAFEPYVGAVRHAFGDDVAFAQVVKSYEETPAGRGRYSPSRIVNVEKEDVIGYPDMELVSTSYVERQNVTIRMQVRRLTRLTNAFSKKAENLKATMDLHFTHYNFVRFHRSIRCTPAIEAGVASSPLTVKDLVDMAA